MYKSQGLINIYACMYIKKDNQLFVVPLSCFAITLYRERERKKKKNFFFFSVFNHTTTDSLCL